MNGARPRLAMLQFSQQISSDVNLNAVIRSTYIAVMQHVCDFFACGSENQQPVRYIYLNVMAKSQIR